jgi:hypothetical protein
VSESRPSSERLVTIQGDLEAVQEAFRERRWTDGLPIMPPTVKAVAHMVDTIDEPADAVLGAVAPLWSVATVEKVAVNAVMAGCRPEHFPTVVAATRALLTPEFNLYPIQATTNPGGPLVIVHGPEVRRIGMNSKAGVLGPGNVANACIGRALRFVMLNLGGGRAGEGDFSTHGSPIKFTYCMAENVDESPWPEFHTTRGFDSDASAVTVVGVEGPHNVNDHESTTIKRNLDIIVDAMKPLAHQNWYVSGCEMVVVLGPEHADLARRDGWTRHDVQAYLHQRTVRPVAELATGGMWGMRAWSRWRNGLAGDPEALIPLVDSPDHILVFVAGGPGKHSMMMPGLGNITRGVTMPITHKGSDAVS